MIFKIKIIIVLCRKIALKNVIFKYFYSIYNNNVRFVVKMRKRKKFV